MTTTYDAFISYAPQDTASADAASPEGLNRAGRAA